MRELPVGWEAPALEEVARVNPGRLQGIEANTVVSFVSMPAVSDRDGEISSPVLRPFAEVSKGYTQFREGDVIFAKITPCMENGKIAVARSLSNGVACGSTEFHVVRPLGEIPPDFIWRFLRQRSYRDAAEMRMTGAVGQRRVPSAFLEKTSVPLPPLAEQRRIVAKIDSLTAKSGLAREHLDHIPRLVEKYQQAVLAAAFAASSTGARYPRANLDLALNDIRYGTAKKCEYGVGDVGVLRIPNIQRGTVSLDDLKSASFTVSERRKLSLQVGDVLVIRSNGSLSLVGRSAVVGAAAEGLVYAGYLIRLRLDHSILRPDFLHLWLQSPEARTTIERLAKSTTGVNNINSTQLEQLHLPMPDVDTQAEIVRRIETAFAAIDRLAAEATSARRLLDRLDQSILAKAFRGELVPQDPNDEPASVLLERIRAERAATSKPKRGRARKVNHADPA